MFNTILVIKIQILLKKLNSYKINSFFTIYLVYNSLKIVNNFYCDNL